MSHKRYAFYREDNGLFSGDILTAHDRDLATNTPAGFKAIEAAGIDLYASRVDVATGKIIDYQPPAPSPDHEWNATIKRWELNAAAAAQAASMASARVRIAALEASSLRALREKALGSAEAITRLQAIDDEIATLRQSLPLASPSI